MKQKKKKLIHFTSIDELVSLRQSKDIDEYIDSNLSFADKLSDKLASFAGSWTFILTFAFIIIVWITINAIQLGFGTFDPYPFILLNLCLSTVAALQAPIIMMSQNRQEEKDRIRSEHDYHVNLKAEILIEEILVRLDELEEQNHKMLEYLKKYDEIKKNEND